MDIKRLSPVRRVQFPVSRSYQGVVTNLSVRLKAVQCFNRNYHVIKGYCDQLSATGWKDPRRPDIYRVTIVRTFWGLRTKVIVAPVN